MSRGFLGLLGLLGLFCFSVREEHDGRFLKTELREKGLWGMFRGLRREWELCERSVLNKDIRVSGGFKKN